MPLFSSPGPNLRPPSRRRNFRVVGWTIIALILAIVAWVGVTGAMALKSIVATNNNSEPSIFKGSLNPSQVVTEGDSRINILLAGIGGPGHSGPDLTDTLELYSIDPVNKTIALLSIPRDLYVAQPDGSRGRINAINTEGAQFCKKNYCAAGVDQGGAAMESSIGQLLGIQINYFVRLNFQGFQQLVDTLGGIDVNVPTALIDPLYPCPDPSTAYCPIHIKAGLTHFDGATALKYARSRETTSDFSRAARQQQVIAAIRRKGLTAGILANPSKLTQLINILGRNVRTDIQPGNFSALLSLVNQIDESKMTTTVLDTSATGPLTSSVIGGADVIIPKAGLTDFSAVKDFVAGVLRDPNVVKEAATVTLINASGRPTEGTLIAAQLKNLGYNVVSVSAAPQVQVSSTLTKSKTKPFSVALLQKRFHASTVAADPAALTDITIVVGSHYVLK